MPAGNVLVDGRPVQTNVSRKFFGDALLYFVSEVAIGLFSVFALPLFATHYPPELYGVWTQILVTTALVFPILTFGFQTTVVRFVSGERDPYRISALFHWMGLIILVVLLAVQLLIALTPGMLAKAVFSDAAFVNYVPLLGWFLAGFSLFSFELAFLRAIEQIKLLSVLNIAYAVGRLALLLVIASVFKGTLEDVVLG
ncbi:MAG: oligosaccharide flippase family protein, partial [Bdellovibrionales bacterium]|nr:oligosaccharide flippase family protein [Bdellovibrionales bacterium]